MYTEAIILGIILILIIISILDSPFWSITIPVSFLLLCFLWFYKRSKEKDEVRRLRKRIKELKEELNKK